MSIWTITSMNIPFDSIVEPPALAGNCSTGSSSRQLPQSPERMMGLSRVSGQRGRETAICSGYATQGDTPIKFIYNFNVMWRSASSKIVKTDTTPHDIEIVYK